MKKLNGYRPSHRNRWMLVENKILSLQELSLLEFYIDLMDFDKKHDGYGKFEVDFKEMMLVFNCKSSNTIRNWHNTLLKLGFIKKTQKHNIYALSTPERNINPGAWGGKASEFAQREKDQPIAVILQNIGIELQAIEEKVQPVVKKGDDLALKGEVKALGSSKDESKDNQVKQVLIKQEARTEEEYQKMYQENPDGLIPEDMRWVDENVTETLEFTSENEKEIVEIYFGGDWGKYQMYLITEWIIAIIKS